MMYYEKKGTGPAVVLLHGFPSDHTIWNQVSPAIAAGYTVLLPDFPGAGQSAPAEPLLTLDHIARSVAAILEKENIPRAIIAGHSMGGYTALAFARMFPEKTAALSLVHSSAYADTDEKKTNRRKAIALISKGDVEKEIFLEAMAPNLFAPAFAAAHPEVVRSIVEKGKSLPAAALIAFYQAIMNRGDTTDVLRQATFPVQWIIGETDTATPMQDALQQAHLAPVSSISLYTGCGHMSMLERPEQLTKDLLSFFAFVFSSRTA